METTFYYWGQAKHYRSWQHRYELTATSLSAASNAEAMYALEGRFEIEFEWTWQTIEEALAARGTNNWGSLLRAVSIPTETADPHWFQLPGETECDCGWVPGYMARNPTRVRQDRLALLFDEYVS